ncbi:hypothetical protein M3629_15075 [Paenibacillus polysaccharolyticus]|uniref:hypothetical protein n=1 Tax=Paenibacillus polysaccharolyticus TaxID=582692 RepID=UPI00203FC789|nr:hypothetical protein [Paenibacillus polysaccharolyticus]MCM3134113.1 hypothetical protein [Paenibacillus polysaccharolyticus]
MRIILPIIASILSIGGGWLFAYLILLLMLSGDDGLIIFDVPPASHTLLYLVLTLLPFVVAVYVLNKKEKSGIIGTIIVSFIASVVMYFIVVPNQSAILDFFRTPSKHVQSEIQSQVQEVIDRNQLPFVIDQKVSERQTQDEAIRTVVYMNTKTEGDLQKNEIKPLVSMSFETDVRLVIIDKANVNHVSIVIDKGKEVSCSDESYCE